MTRRVLPVLAILVALTVIVTPLGAQRSAEDEIKRLTDAATVLDEIMGAADKAVPRAVLERAEGIAHRSDRV